MTGNILKEEADTVMGYTCFVVPISFMIIRLIKVANYRFYKRPYKDMINLEK
ncbi:MAG: hypothetical protein K9K37_05250 [Desulfocapsa sp.]|nr:hypothetical protein [Desulfocapsa sp.]